MQRHRPLRRLEKRHRRDHPRRRPAPNWNANSFGPTAAPSTTAGDLFVIGYDNEVSIRIDAVTLQIEELGLSPGRYKYGMGVDQNGNMYVGAFSGPDHI